jgi:hypothetical protein
MAWSSSSCEEPRPFLHKVSPLLRNAASTLTKCPGLWLHLPLLQSLGRTRRLPPGARSLGRESRPAVLLQVRRTGRRRPRRQLPQASHLESHVILHSCSRALPSSVPLPSVLIRHPVPLRPGSCDEALSAPRPSSTSFWEAPGAPARPPSTRPPPASRPSAAARGAGGAGPGPGRSLRRATPPLPPRVPGPPGVMPGGGPQRAGTAGPGRVGLGWVGSGRVGLGRVGLGRAGLDRGERGGARGLGHSVGRARFRSSGKPRRGARRAGPWLPAQREPHRVPVPGSQRPATRGGRSARGLPVPGRGRNPGPRARHRPLPTGTATPPGAQLPVPRPPA